MEESSIDKQNFAKVEFCFRTCPPLTLEIFSEMIGNDPAILFYHNTQRVPNWYHQVSR
jgi:hypothetical protein